MIKHWFSSMFEILEEVAGQYPLAQGNDKLELEQQLQALKDMSDEILDEWLHFTEKLNELPFEGHVEFTDELAQPDHPLFETGQGYFRLCMYANSAKSFGQLMNEQPHCEISRLYLGMSLLQLEQNAKAIQQFKQLVQSRNKEICVMACHAMGGIYMQQHHFDKAKHYFSLADSLESSTPYYK